MGYRPNIVKRYEVEYGSEIGGFNYDPQGLDNFFSSLDLDFSWEYSENNDTFYIKADSVRALQNKDLSQIKAFDKLEEEDNPTELVESVVKILVSALDSDYCKNYDMVKIEFL
jgi:hypothetical protein